MERDKYFDALKGIAILFVIAIHTYSKQVDVIPLTCRQVLNCAVPLFLACSGYFLANKDLSTREARRSFWKHQIPKVYVPCLVWSIPLYVLAIHTGDRNFVINTLFLFICGFSIYYFVALIIQLYVLLPVIQQVRLTGGGML